MSIDWALVPPKVRLDNLTEKNQELQQIREEKKNNNKAASSSAQPASTASSASSSEGGQEPWSLAYDCADWP
eukprot:11189368-Lingulodinium_polyedra.AAC.1